VGQAGRSHAVPWADRAAGTVAAMAGRPAGAIPVASERVAAFLPAAAGTFAAAAERAGGAAGSAVAAGGLDVPARTPGPTAAVRTARSRPATTVNVTAASLLVVAPTTSLYGRGWRNHDNPGTVGLIGAAAAAFAPG
jgi:hypothetical protein